MPKELLNRILFVEDDPDIQEVARMALELIGGFTVVTASSGKEALELLDVVKPQLILLDVMMPEMDGPTTLKKIHTQANWTDIPVIFLTAKVQEEDRKEYKELGAIDTIAKPFDPMNISNHIKQIWKNYSVIKKEN